MARPIVRILSRYILRQHIPPLGYALAALTFAMLVNQVAKQFGNFVGKGLPWSIVFEVFALSIPFIVAMTLPMAVLVAVLYTFSHLAADNEITALKASGISVGRLLQPVVGGATLVALVAFLWNDQILPRSNHALRTLLVDIQRKKPTFQLKEQVINEVVTKQFFLRAARIDPAANTLSDVTIYDLEDPDRRRIIMADSGRMAYTPGGTDLYLTLHDGEVHEFKRSDPEHFNRTFYSVNRIKVAGVSNTFTQTENDTYRGDREMTICAMEEVVAHARRDMDRTQRDALIGVTGELRRLIKLATPPAAPFDTTLPPPSLYCRALGGLQRLIGPTAAQAQGVRQATPPPTPRHGPSPPQRGGGGATPRPPSLTERPTATAVPYSVQQMSLTAYEQQLRGARMRAATYQVEIQKKLAISAACIIFALLGVPIAIRFPRGGVGLVIGTSLAVFSIYYVGLIGGEEFGDRLIVPPFFSMWTPNLIFLIVSIPLLWTVGRAGSSTHGGDWQDMKRALLAWVAKR
ncbi:MAG TPA: LptF/LptG family permease [Gemmatimonadales bacterium]|nr:LptF/LptG family permease [Gemmatimonadales bacterium]